MEPFTLGQILMVLGLGGTLGWIVKHYVTRNSARRDKREDKREEKQDVLDERSLAVQTKQIDADKHAFDIFANRLKDVEDRLHDEINKLREEVGDQREMNARKDENIKHLGDENKNLRAEVEKLREDRREQDRIIAALRSELDVLKLFVNSHHGADLGTVENPLNVVVDEKED